jgi:hypothetical protein
MSTISTITELWSMGPTELAGRISTKRPQFGKSSGPISAEQ